MKAFACVVLLAAAALAAPSQRDKRGYLHSDWAPLDHHDLGYSLDHAHAYSDYAHGYGLGHISDYGHAHIGHSFAPAHKIVSYDKVVTVPKVVEVKRIVSVPKVVSIPKVVSVSKIVEDPHHISYGSYDSHGWW